MWYSEERPGRAGAPPSPLLTVPNVTAHPSTAMYQLFMLFAMALSLPLDCKGLMPVFKFSVGKGVVSRDIYRGLAEPYLMDSSPGEVTYK